MKDLSRDNDILVLKADKGNCTVVMNSADYYNQVREMVGDRNTYQQITDKRRNPTKRTETDLQKKLLHVKKQGSLSESEYKKLRPSDTAPAAFYGPPKVHKVTLEAADDNDTLSKDETATIPLRPINSCINSPTYAVSKYLASVLKHLGSESNYAVKNAKEFAHFVNTQKVAEDEQIVSFDVTALFTSVPVDLAMEITKRKLSGTDSWKDHTNLSQGEILDLLSFVLSNSYFTFEEKHYHQISGCTMGSPVINPYIQFTVELPTSMPSWGEHSVSGHEMYR